MTYLAEAKRAYSAGMDHWKAFTSGEVEPVIPAEYDTKELRHWFAKGAVHMGKSKGELKQERGRPPLPPEERKEVNIIARCGRPLKEALKKAAEESGRTLSTEIISRLERSFILDDVRTIIRQELRNQHLTLGKGS